MNSRLLQMIQENKLPIKHGLWIDTYNQITDADCAGTILTGISYRHIHFIMEEKIQIRQNTKSGSIQMELGGVCDLSYPSSKTRRGRVQDGGTVTPTLTAHTENSLRRIESSYRIRKLTPRECFRLMGVAEPDIDTLLSSGISDSQLYKLAGNSIVVNCLAAIFRQMFIGNFNNNQQLEIF